GMMWFATMSAVFRRMSLISGSRVGIGEICIGASGIRCRYGTDLRPGRQGRHQRCLEGCPAYHYHRGSRKRRRLQMTERPGATMAAELPALVDLPLEKRVDRMTELYG